MSTKSRYLLLFVLISFSQAWAAGREISAQSWQNSLLAVPYRSPFLEQPIIQVLRQDYETLRHRNSILKTPITIGAKRFERGLGTHSISHIRVYYPEPIEQFYCWIGVDNNERTGGTRGSVVFKVATGGKDQYCSKIMRASDAAEKIDIQFDGVNVIDLMVGDANDGPAFDHADWADAKIIVRGGKTVWLDDLNQQTIPMLWSLYPFSFNYGGKSNSDILETWQFEKSIRKTDSEATITTNVWTDHSTGLRTTWEVVSYADFPAMEWLFYFENTDDKDTLVIDDVQPMDISINVPLNGDVPYRLYKSRGGTPDPMHFEPTVVAVNSGHSETLTAGAGRSSTVNLPFFKIETGDGSLVVAVGWSGNWLSRIECPDNHNLRLRAGLDKTHFVLHRGEKIRTPRILILNWQGDTLEANAQFRQLIYKYYTASRKGKPPLPTLFCNTAFTRGGAWLNECNAENQISLIRAYGKLGIEALITDAGWFTGGWPGGAGNWDVRKDAYPDGMKPVAAEAKECGLIYGLWFEPERVVPGTTIHKEHPEWCLKSKPEGDGTLLLNFGLVEVQNYFFNIVRSFMDLPGFRVYRQDFNMDPLLYWRFNDAPDRVGITETKYVMGLYAYWDRIRSTWPDALLEECASGGHRIDLETIMRLHIAQKTDYWFDDDADQTALWGISQYLPNNTIVAHLNNLTDYSFHSTIGSSLCLGWIADAPDFDFKRAKFLIDKYRQVRHLLTASWYPLLPYNRDASHWMACQYHRPDLDEGMVLFFRHRNSPYSTVDVSLRGLKPDAIYELVSDSTGEKKQIKGSELMAKLQLMLQSRRSSDLIVYRISN